VAAAEAEYEVSSDQLKEMLIQALIGRAGGSSEGVEEVNQLLAGLGLSLDEIAGVGQSGGDRLIASARIFIVLLS
jgi:hypothetical protein